MPEFRPLQDVVLVVPCEDPAPAETLLVRVNPSHYSFGRVLAVGPGIWKVKDARDPVNQKKHVFIPTVVRPGAIVTWLNAVGFSKQGRQLSWWLDQHGVEAAIIRETDILYEVDPCDSSPA